MDDLIKRADAVNAVCELALDEDEAGEFYEAIENIPGVGIIDPLKFEKAEDVFERMSFESTKERDLLKYVFTHHFEPCDVCVYRKGAEDPDCELECDVCGKCECPCINCWISGADENFVLDAEFVESKIRKDEEK